MAQNKTETLISRVSFTPYDLMGYLVPGGMCLAAIAGFEAFVLEFSPETRLHTPVLTALVRLMNAATVEIAGKPAPVDAAWVIQVLVLLLAATVCYVIGHIIASLSALAIDRWYVAQAHGYPFRFLLSIPDRTRNLLSTKFHRGFFCWLNIYLVLRFTALPNGLRLEPLFPEYRDSLILTILSAERLNFLASFIGWVLSSMIVVNVALAVDKHFDNWLRNRVLQKRFGPELMAKVKGALVGIAAPGLVINAWLGEYMHSRDPLDPITAKRFKEKLLAILGVREDDPDVPALLSSSTTFWLAYIHLRSDAAISAPIENWLRLYGFARNLAASLYIAFLYCFGWWMLQGDLVPTPPAISHFSILVLPLLYFTASFLLLLRYYYLYVGYFTKYILRGFVYSTRTLSKENGIPDLSKLLRWIRQ